MLGSVGGHRPLGSRAPSGLFFCAPRCSGLGLDATIRYTKHLEPHGDISYNMATHMATEKVQEMVPVHARYPRELKERLEQVASEDRRTLTTTLHMAAELFLAQREAEKAKSKRGR